MKFSTVQLAILVLALGVSAAPSVSPSDCGVEPPSTADTGSAIPDQASAPQAPKKAAAKTKKKGSKTTEPKNEDGSDNAAPASKPAESKAPKPGSGDGSYAADPAPKAPKPASGGGSYAADPAPKAPKPAGSAVPSSKAPKTTSTPTKGGGATGGGKMPDAVGTSVLPAAQTIAAGGSFDGGMVMFDRGVSCTGQVEGGDRDAVFMIENGGSLSNVIIGPNQVEGIHCQGACKLNNVWWSAVCEDAFTIKNQAAGETTTIIGGGAFGAADKVFQHNGGGTLNISGFTCVVFGKLYRACGNCATSVDRHVIMDNITATDGHVLAGVNGNFGDTATITNSKVSRVESICTNFKGVPKGNEPTKVSEGADGVTCIFGADVINTY